MDKPKPKSETPKSADSNALINRAEIAVKLNLRRSYVDRMIATHNKSHWNPFPQKYCVINRLHYYQSKDVDAWVSKRPKANRPKYQCPTCGQTTGTDLRKSNE